MMADEEEEVKPILQKLQELVDQLYSFRDCYFETHSVEDAGRKQQDVRKEMEKTLQQMEEVVGSVQGKAQVLMLTGKALNVTPDYSPKAEELLSKAVKLEPKLVEAWNQLGEVYWKKGILQLPTPASQEPLPIAGTKSPYKTYQWCFASCGLALKMNILTMSWTVSDRLSWLFRWMSMMAAPGISLGMHIFPFTSLLARTQRSPSKPSVPMPKQRRLTEKLLAILTFI